MPIDIRMTILFRNSPEKYRFLIKFKFRHPNQSHKYSEIPLHMDFKAEFLYKRIYRIPTTGILLVRQLIFLIKTLQSI